MKKMLLLLIVSSLLFSFQKGSMSEGGISSKFASMNGASFIQVKTLSAYIDEAAIRKAYGIPEGTEVSVEESNEGKNLTANWVVNSLPPTDFKRMAMLLVTRMHEFKGNAADVKFLAETKQAEYLEGVGEQGAYFIPDERGGIVGFFFVKDGFMFRIHSPAYLGDKKKEKSLALAKHMAGK
ncbi:MAG: hypothetical protein EP338_04205 [Bacteroidetes bacterium]|nr:MAG: hypothetical protein EP338_04205 [Bacteroidota bacterium]